MPLKDGRTDGRTDGRAGGREKEANGKFFLSRGGGGGGKTNDVLN